MIGLGRREISAELSDVCRNLALRSGSQTDAVGSQVNVPRYLQFVNKIRTLLKYELPGEIPLAR